MADKRAKPKSANFTCFPSPVINSCSFEGVSHHHQRYINKMVRSGLGQCCTPKANPTHQLAWTPHDIYLTYIVRFQITMQNAIGMTTSHTGNDLSQKGPHCGNRKSHALCNVIGFLEFIHVRLQIVCHEFKDQIQSSGMRLNDIQQSDLSFI